MLKRGWRPANKGKPVEGSMGNWKFCWLPTLHWFGNTNIIYIDLLICRAGFAFSRKSSRVYQYHHQYIYVACGGTQSWCVPYVLLFFIFVNSALFYSILTNYNLIIFPCRGVHKRLDIMIYHMCPKIDSIGLAFWGC